MRFSFLDQLFQDLVKTKPQAVIFICTLHKTSQTQSNTIVNVITQQVFEPLKQALLMLQDIVQKCGRKASLIIAVTGIKRILCFFGQRGFGDTGTNPLIKAECKHLAPQHFRRFQKNTGRNNIALKHLAGILKKIEIMGT